MVGWHKCVLSDRYGQKYNLTLKEPSIEDLYESQLIYQESYNDAIADDVYNDKEYLRFLVENDHWSKEEEKELEQLPKTIEDLKVSLYKAFAQSNTRNGIRREIKDAKKRCRELLDKKHKYDYLSAHGIASMAQVYYLTAKTSVINNSLYKIEYDDPNLILDKIIAQKAKFRVDEGTLREIARNDPWKSYWACGNVFGKPAIELTEDQRNLIIISNMYDNISQSPDCPAEYVIEEDDMLDGWIIVQRRKRQSEQAQLEGESKLNSKIAQSQMIFIPAETEEDIKRINEMNSPAAQIEKVQRMSQLSKKGEMKIEEFSAERIKILNQLSKKG